MKADLFCSKCGYSDCVNVGGNQECPCEDD